MELNKNSNYNFIGNRKKAYIFSAILIALTLVSLVVRKGPNMSIDFVGGTSLQLDFKGDVTGRISDVKGAISDLGMGTPEVKVIGTPTAEKSELQVIVKRNEHQEAVADTIKAAIKAKISDIEFEVPFTKEVGPKIGKELQGNAIWAVLLSLLVIVIYIGIRFHFPFGVAAIVALFHDVIVTIGVFSLLGWEISLPIIAAILTIVGYSLNDTIVVFDRIRENLDEDKKDKEHFEDKINSSINQTLSRTLITSLTTFVVVLSIFIFFFTSADVLKYFSGALIVGVISGTYSSIFIASPVLVFWNKKWPIES